MPKRLIVLLLVSWLSIVTAAEEPQDSFTVFETFDSDPTSRGWINASTGTTQFTYNSGGWMDASISRDSANRSGFYLPLGFVADQTQEPFWSMDVMLLSTGNDYQQALLGVFNRSIGSNHQNVVATRFFMRAYQGTQRGNRHDAIGYDSTGTLLTSNGAPTSPGVPLGAAVRVQQHYWHDGNAGRSEMTVHQIRTNGSTGSLIMAAGPTTVIGAGKTLEFDIFGLVNRTDGGWLTANVIKVDNLYFSTLRQNTSPAIPSFGGLWGLPGDFSGNGRIGLDDFSILASHWLDACEPPAWCMGADINQDGLVSLSDLGTFIAHWLDAEPFSGYAIASEKDIPYLGPDRPTLDIYYPDNPQSGDRFPGIVIIHGGGWTGGRKDANREINIATTLVQEGYVCVSISYQLGSGSWPQNIQDCKSAVQFLRVNADQYRINPDRIGVIGGSAGGHLACMVGYVEPAAGLEPTAPYPGVNSQVQAVVNLYGITNLLTRQETDPDGTPNGILKDGTAPTMLGCGRTVCPNLWTLASPVTHVTATSPPTLTLHGTRDITVDYDQAIELDAVLTQAGAWSELHLLEGLGHTFDLQPSGYDLRPLVVGFFDTFLKD